MQSFKIGERVILIRCFDERHRRYIGQEFTITSELMDVPGYTLPIHYLSREDSYRRFSAPPEYLMKIDPDTKTIVHHERDEA